MHTGFKLIILASVLYALETDLIPLGKTSYICNDPKLSHELYPDTVSVRNLLLSVYILPFLVLSLIGLLKQKTCRKMCRKSVKFYYKKCFLGSVFLLLTTEVIKAVVKEPRPHFFHSCAPNANSVCESGSVVFDYNCTNTKINYFQVLDSARSFPSGHTAVSVYITIYCIYLIWTYLTPIGRHYGIVLTRILLIIFFISWTLLCSLSRISDKRHHWWDVVGGAFLGLCSATYLIGILQKDIFLQNLKSTEN